MQQLEALLNQPLIIEPLNHALLRQKNIQIDVLRADLIHPCISGNKLFKLWPYFKQLQSHHKAVLSFGGAHSNHLYALAYACHLLKIPCICIIRGGEKPTYTLKKLEQWGADIIKISRKEYQMRHQPDWIKQWQQRYPDTCIIPEGGSGEMGVQGCIDWGSMLCALPYDQIAVATGTGTTALGLAIGSQKPVLAMLASKDVEVPDRMEQLRTEHFAEKTADIHWLEAYHFGGFAKQTAQLNQFIERFNQSQSCRVEPVYTGKLAFGIWDLIQQDIIQKGSKLLMIHTGGLRVGRLRAEL